MSPKGSHRELHTQWLEFEEAVRSHIDIVDVIKEHITLIEKGRHYEGECPFHEVGVKKRINVSPSRQWFACMSDGCANGDAFDFIARLKGISKNEAVRLLARKIGIPEERIKTIDDYEEAISYSMLKTFQQCPLRFKYRYIKGIPDERPTFYLAVGRAIHAALASFFQIPITGQRTRDELLGLLHKHWSRYGFSTKEEEQDWLARSEEMLINYYNTHDSMAEPVAVEQDFSCRVGGLVLKGRLDRVDKTIDGSYEVIDYKIGREDFDRANKSDDLQLLFYYYGATRALGLPITKLTNEYLAANETVTHSVDEGKMTNKISILEELVRDLRSTTSFKPRRNEFCGDCLIRPKCPTFR